jgi:hypothetical protein
MSSSTSSSRAGGPETESREALGADPERRGAKGARLFLAAMAGGAVLSAAIASAAPESWIHTGPEYGMAEAFEDHVERVCAEKATPAMLIIGDSRAVAAVAVNEIRAVGISAEKFALGGSGIFTGWAVLDRLIDCGVKPKTVVMAFGTIHMIEPGAIMDRTANYDLLKGPRTGHAYAMASEWEHRIERKLTFKAVSLLGNELTLVDLALLRPALRNVLEKPPLALVNRESNEGERVSFLASNGDRFYGQDEKAPGLPDEAEFGEQFWIPEINYRATEAIARLGKDNGFNVLFYTLPISGLAKAGLPASIFTTAEKFHADLAGMGVTPINDIWVLPDMDFGDPSHVNARGRAIVTSDFLARYTAYTLAEAS